METKYNISRIKKPRQIFMLLISCYVNSYNSSFRLISEKTFTCFTTMQKNYKTLNNPHLESDPGKVSPQIEHGLLKAPID